MHDDDAPDTEPGTEAFNPEAVLWIRGVDYVSGWRDAHDAIEELSDTLTTAGIEASQLRLRADTTGDGFGLVWLTCSPDTARHIAKLARIAATRKA